MKAIVKETREVVDVVLLPGTDTGIDLYADAKDETVIYFDYELETMEYYGG